ncbi:MAG: hypothetical protein PUC15_08010 [Lentisphaeria bacterium]|nr:hypothetical protein [Lentisphaeria bacterium]
MKSTVLNAIQGKLAAVVTEAQIIAAYREAGIANPEPGEILSDAHAGELVIVSRADYEQASNSPKKLNGDRVLWYCRRGREGAVAINEPA